MSAGVRLYRALIRLLPREIREHDGDEMLRTLAEQRARSPRPHAITLRALARFPAVLALEWRDALLTDRQRHQPLTSQSTRMDAITRMIRQGSRSLVRTPAFSLSVVLLLALGVGSVTAIFAVVDHVLLRPLPYASADRLFVVRNGSHSIPAFRDFQGMTSVEAWGAASTDEANLTGHGEPQRIRNAIINDGFFPMFGARAAIGRLFQASDFQSAGSAVLSYGTWIRLFGGDSAVVGTTILVNGEARTVIGVTGQDFAAPEAVVDRFVDVWQPIDPGWKHINERDYWSFSVVGRLRPTASLAQAEQQIDRIANDRAKAFPKFYVQDGKVSTLPLKSLQEYTSLEVSKGLTLIFGAVSLLLLVACANVTHLFLARGVARTREMAVRRALGANTRSLVAQLLTESLLLAMTGVVIGLGIAYVGVRAYLALMPEGLPRVDTIRIDLRVAAFAAGIGIVTSIVFGLLPALRLTRSTVADPLRAVNRSITGGRAAHALRSAIVVGEVALSLVLVAQAGWLLRSFIRVTSQELGFRTAGVLTIPMSVTGIDSASVWYTRMDALRESIAQTPGITQVAFGLTMPLEWVGGGRCCWGGRPTIPGKGKTKNNVSFLPVSDGYFRLLDIPMIAGAAWTPANANASPHPIVINERLAVEAFGSSKAAIGAAMENGKLAFVVTGVAPNVRHYGSDQEVEPAAYLPARTIPFAPGRVTMAVLTNRSDERLAADLRTAIWRAEPNLPVPTIRSLKDWSHRDSAQRRFESALFTTFSTIALLLVAAGLASTLLYMVSMQRRSLGIRLALGATPRNLERGVMVRGMILAATGVVIGSVAAWFTGRLIESRLYGVSTRDLSTLSLAIGVLLTIALASSWLPARRAAGTDPIESLRME